MVKKTQLRVSVPFEVYAGWSCFTPSACQRMRHYILREYCSSTSLSTLSFPPVRHDTRCNSNGCKCQEYYICLLCDIQGAPLCQINNFIMTSCEDFGRNAAGLVLWPGPLSFSPPVVGAEVRLRRSINTAILTVLLDCNLTCVPAANPPGRFPTSYISSVCKNCQAEGLANRSCKINERDYLSGVNCLFVFLLVCR